MDVIVTTETRFFSDDQGRAVCADGTYAYRFWTRYLDVFERVWILGRKNPQVIEGGVAAEGDRVRLVPLPDSRGLGGLVRNAWNWRRVMNRMMDKPQAFVLRMPGQVGQFLGDCLLRRGIPYGVEVVGDPATAFAAGSCDHPLRAGLRVMSQRGLRRLCANASGVAYVTRDYLQRHYPASPGACTASYSSIQLPEAAFVAMPRPFHSHTSARRLVCVGTMSQPYKGHDILLSALEICRRHGFDLHLTIVGDGRLRGELEQMARQLKLIGVSTAAAVNFAGQLASGEPIWNALDEADLYVHPSRSEGLPRALIEAQARALPCLGSHVGGIPELLQDTELVAPGRADLLAEAIMQLLADRPRLTRLSSENLQRSRDFAASRLQQRRVDWYRALRHATETSSHAIVAEAA